MTLRGNIWQQDGIRKMFKPAMIESVKRLCLIAEDAAKIDLAGKLGPRSSGILFGTFYYDLPIKQSYEVKGMVFAGGPKAPYAPIVDYIGWTTKKGKKAPYHFMRIGAMAAQKAANTVLKEEFIKILK